MNCQNCNAQNEYGAKFCHLCGDKLSIENSNRSPAKSSISIFNQYSSLLKQIHNNSDVIVFPYIGDDIKSNIKYNFRLDLDDTILYVRDTSFWDTRNQGTVISTNGISFIEDNNKPNDIRQFSWNQISYAEYKDQRIYLFGYEGRQDYFFIHLSLFIKNSDNLDDCVRYGKILAGLITKIAKLYERTETPYEIAIKEYNALMSEYKLSEALDFAKKCLSDDSFRWVFLIHIIQDHYIIENKWDEIITICDEEINRSSENGNNMNNTYYLDFHYYRGIANYNLQKYKQARADFFLLSKTAPEAKLLSNTEMLLKQRSIDLFNETNKAFCQDFLQLKYSERKLLFTTDKYTDLSQKSINPIDKYHLSEINFPIGHPIMNQLYVGHPYVPNNYLVFEDYQLELIEDKIREFCQIMQSIGATEISIGTSHFNNTGKEFETTLDVTAEANSKVHNASGSYSKNKKSNLLERISKTLTLNQKYNPTSKAKLPEKLVWYMNEPSWQRLYEQRMHGSLISHEEKIETKKSRVINGSETNNIKAEFNSLIIGAKGTIDRKTESAFESEEDAIISIKVKFKPLESLEGDKSISTNISLTPNEEEYVNEYNLCIEEGPIGSRERRLLDKIRISLGIDEYRATELESLQESLAFTEEEKEYFEEFQNCFDSEKSISNTERRLLNRLRDSLGISEERAVAIENNYINS